MKSNMINAAIIIIGNEILSGRTDDVNLQFLAQRLNRLGIRLEEARIVLDSESKIVEAVNALREQVNYVFTTGGIGPTHDDITSSAIAAAFGVGYELHPEAESILREYYKKKPLTQARLKMAKLPVGAKLLYNPISKAPGFRVENVFVLPGVPGILRAMFDNFSHELVGGQPVLSGSVSTDLGEGTIGDGLAAIQSKFSEVEIGSYPFFKDGKFGTSLVARHTNEKKIGIVVDAFQKLILSHGGNLLN